MRNHGFGYSAGREFALWVILIGLVLAYGCAPVGPRAPSITGTGPVIRVLLGEEAGQFVVETKGGFRVESEGGMVLARSNDPSRITVRWREQSIETHFDPQGTAAVAEGNIYITPFKSSSLGYRDVVYSGRFLVQLGESGRVRVINVLPVEKYLEGVLPHEIGDPGPDAFAAMEAQAIAARTYAMTRMKKRANEPFDVYASVRDQVYRGQERANRLASGAVRETRGVVLMYGSELARTYYCATCGGHTSDIRRVWPQRDPAPYLRGGLDRGRRGGDSFCSWVHNFRWRYSFTGRELGAILRKTIPGELRVDAARVERFVDINVAERSPSGRVYRLDIVTTEGTFTARSDRIRWVLMVDPDEGRILPSTMFDIHKETQNGQVTSVSFVGGGNGHGVGMCQNGAIEMARKGYNRDMILKHYYPGTSLTREY